MDKKFESWLSVTVVSALCLPSLLVSTAQAEDDYERTVPDTAEIFESKPAHRLRLVPDLAYRVDGESDPQFTAQFEYIQSEKWKGEDLQVYRLRDALPEQDAILVVGPKGFDITEIGATKVVDHMMLSLSAEFETDTRFRSIPGKDINLSQGEVGARFSYLRTERRMPSHRRVYRMRNTEVNLTLGFRDGQGMPPMYTASDHGRAEGGFVTSESKRGFSFCMLGGGKVDIEMGLRGPSFSEAYGSLGLWPGLCWSRESPKQPFIMVGPRVDIRVGDHLDGNLVATVMGGEALYTSETTRATFNLNARVAGSDIGSSQGASVTVLKVVRRNWLVGATLEARRISYENGAVDIIPKALVNTGYVFTGRKKTR